MLSHDLIYVTVCKKYINSFFNPNFESPISYPRKLKIKINKSQDISEWNCLTSISQYKETVKSLF